MIEYIAIGAIVASALGFAGWRAFQTVRTAKGAKGCETGCGKCEGKG